MKNLFFFVLFVLSVFFLAHETDAVITCDTVESNAFRCLSFATGIDAMPSAACCSGMEQLAQSAQSVDDKKAVCRCLKDKVKNVRGIQDRFIDRIPEVCKITVGFPISLSIDCDKIH